MTSGNRLLSLIVPVYFNSESLLPLHSEILALEQQLAAESVSLELIFVDDGSGDDSLAKLLEIKRARPATKVLRLSRNFGAVAASKTGLRYVKGDAFAIIAADLQDPPAQILPMVAEWLKGAKFVVSARSSRGDPIMTRAFAWLYYWMLKQLVIKGYPEGGYDLMLMDRCMLATMAGSPKHTNPNVYAFWHGFKPVILSYTRRERRFGRSRWTFGKKFHFFIDTISGFSATPLRLISALGFNVAILSVLYGAYIVVNALLGRFEVQGFATLVALISFFFGLVLVVLGLIGEYIWRILETVNAKPESVVDLEFL